ncbi:MAG: bifunctional folylpolyglutamate synthase/dihydrofolate synthase [Muribaculum sp.]|nr:bifunctional folylpolyglutamate synthase/dihydrofolate synthase [Muribaculum sp.]
MDYQESIDFLYRQLPSFERDGASYKPGLETTLRLAEMVGHPERRLRTIHVAGTNGKGSTSHTLAAVLMSAGYKVGLYTSPHLFDFRERIRVDGRMIEEAEVADFVAHYLSASGEFTHRPTFFELTTVMAFEHFVREGVDVAIIEVGLGGRLDSTNIIVPEVSVITNISKDHTQFLGRTLEEIAGEKAGIMKPGIPVVVGESRGLRGRFEELASQHKSPLTFAEDEMIQLDPATVSLKGRYQIMNARTVVSALARMRERGWLIPEEAVERGFREVERLTVLVGRWTELRRKPLTVCDTGHNVGAWEYLPREIMQMPGEKHIVVGFVADKDVDAILERMPLEAKYYFAEASTPRALKSATLAEMGAKHGLNGRAFGDVASACRAALTDADESDSVFIGGSNYVVAEIPSELRSCVKLQTPHLKDA